MNFFTQILFLKIVCNADCRTKDWAFGSWLRIGIGNENEGHVNGVNGNENGYNLPILRDEVLISYTKISNSDTNTWY